MSCSAFQRLFQPFLDGVLPRSRARAVEAHLATCGACAEEFNCLRRVSAVLMAEPLADPPHGMAAEIAHRAAVHFFVGRRLLVPVWLEALTFGSVILVLAVAAMAGVSYLHAIPALHLAPGVPALLATVAAASGLAAFVSAYYRSLL